MYSSHSRLTLDLITDIHKPYSPASYISKYNSLNNIKSKQWCNIIYTVMLQYSLTLPPPSLPHFCRPMYLYVCLYILSVLLFASSHNLLRCQWNFQEQYCVWGVGIPILLSLSLSFPPFTCFFLLSVLLFCLHHSYILYVLISNIYIIICLNIFSLTLHWTLSC